MSSNGRTQDFGSWYPGSSPGVPANVAWVRTERGMGKFFPHVVGVTVTNVSEERLDPAKGGVWGAQATGSERSGVQASQP